MSDALENPRSFGGNPGEPVPEVDPEDLKTFWHMARDLQARRTGEHIAIGFEAMTAVCKPGANGQVWEMPDVVFRTMEGFRWNGSDTLSDKAFLSTLKGSFAN